jgi:3',5'-cyclic AMP phosphodiesterase CpdA
MRFAHFSDLHLLSLSGAGILDFFNKRWIGAANLVVSRGRHYHNEVFESLVSDLGHQRLDHAICTGDVTNLAMEQEFVFARDHFDRIELGPREVTVIPGNHDAYVGKGADFFSGYFADYHDPDDAWAWPTGSPWPLVRVRGAMAVIGLSTSRTTPWFTAYGEVGGEQLERLGRVLADDRLAGKFRIVALHHRPAGAGSGSVIRGLRDRAALARVIAEAGAELVLHGHEHKDLATTLPVPGGEVAVRGIQSGSYEASKAHLRARYRVYEVGPAGDSQARPSLCGEELRVWNPEIGAFGPDLGR